MTQFTRMTLITCAVILIGAQFARATDPPVIADAKDAPLKVQSLTVTPEDFMSVVTTKNVSDKAIRSFQLGIIMAVPEGCGPAEVYGDQQVFRIDTVDLASGVSVQTLDYKLAPAKLYDFAVSNHADVVQTQLAVVRVDFSDGTSWSIPRSGPVYDAEKMKSIAAVQCSKSESAVLLRANAKCGHLVRSSAKGGGGLVCSASSGLACTNNATGSVCTITVCQENSCPNQSCTCPTCPQPVKPAALN